LKKIPQKSQKDFTQFVAELAGIAPLQPETDGCLPAADWAYDYANIGKSADAVILMNYDQHWRTSASGPIGRAGLVCKNIDAILNWSRRKSWFMGIANYAYDWPARSAKRINEQAKVEVFKESIVTAQSRRKIQFDADSLNPYYSYSDEHILFITFDAR